MKRAFFTIAAWLALSAMAAAPLYYRRDLNMSHTSTISNATSAQHPTQPSGLSLDLAGVEDEQPYDQFHIRIGGPMQHVGTLRGYRLYWKIYEALKKVGQPRGGTGQICHNRRVETQECTKDWDIENIVYNAQPHNTYASNANLKVSVRWSEIREKDNPGLRHEVYALIANVYRLQTEDPANCYEVDFPNSRRTKMCNLPKHLLVVFPVTTNGLQIRARVNVLLEFSGASIEGAFNCKTSLSPICDEFRYIASPNIAKVCNMNYDPIKLYLNCQDKQECFDINDKIYIENGHWKEPDYCGPLGRPWY